MEESKTEETTNETEQSAEPRSVSIAETLNEVSREDFEASQETEETAETLSTEDVEGKSKEATNAEPKKEEAAPLTREQLEQNEREWRAKAFKDFFNIDITTHAAHRTYDKPYEQLSPQEQASIDADDEEYGKPGGRLAWLTKHFMPYVMLAIANERAMTEQRTKAQSSFETEKNEFISGKPELGDKFVALTSGPNALTPKQALDAMRVLYGPNQTPATPKGASKPKALPPVKGSNAPAKDKAVRGSREQSRGDDSHTSTGDDAIDQMLAQLGRR